MLTNILDIGYQCLGGIAFQFSMGRRTTAATLIKKDNAIELRIEKAPMIILTTCPGTTMNK